VAGLAYIREASAQSAESIKLPARTSYAAKFLCGLQQMPAMPPAEPSVKIGNYATSINIHNPGSKTVQLWEKVVIAGDSFAHPITPTHRYTETVQSDWGTAIGCHEIGKILFTEGIFPPQFAEGFVVIDSAIGTAAAELDVVAVYTTASDKWGPVNSIDVVSITGRKLAAGTWPW
jgi:hypothetical protein